MHILLLTPQLPYPPHQGNALRNFHIIKGLAETNEVSLLTFADDTADFGPLVDICTEIVTIPPPKRTTIKRLWQLVTTRRPDMEHRLDSFSFDVALHQLLTENQFDLVQIEGIELARSIDIIRDSSPQSYIVFDNHNAETALQQSAMATDWHKIGRWPAAVYSWIQVQRLRRFELWACAEADAVTVVSEDDKQALGTLIKTHLRQPLRREIKVVPNCIDTTNYQVRDEVQAFDVVFTGKMDYRPNIDAMLWFCDQIWPLLRAQHPEVTLAIVGQKPHARLARLAELEGVTLTGWVETVVPYLHGAKVVVMPLRMGSGTRLKLIEAMAAGAPVVSTPLGVAGYPVVDGRHVLMADQAESFARVVGMLLSDEKLAAALSEAGRELAADYDWRTVIPRFDRLAQSLVRLKV